MVKLADTQDLGSCAFGREGSSPFFRTHSGATAPDPGAFAHRIGPVRGPSAPSGGHPPDPTGAPPPAADGDWVFVPDGFRVVFVPAGYRVVLEPAPVTPRPSRPGPAGHLPVPPGGDDVRAG